MGGQVAGLQRELGLVLGAGQVGDQLLGGGGAPLILGQHHQHIAAQGYGFLAEGGHLNGAQAKLCGGPAGDAVGRGGDEGAVAGQELLLGVVMLARGHQLVIHHLLPEIGHFHRFFVVEYRHHLAIKHLYHGVAILHEHGLDQPDRVGDLKTCKIGRVVDVSLFNSLLGDLVQLLPGCGGRAHVDAGGFHDVFVVVEHLGGDAEGHRAHLAGELAVLPHAFIHILGVEITCLVPLIHAQVTAGAGVQGAGVHQSYVRFGA